MARKREKAEWTWHQNIIPYIGRVVSVSEAQLTTDSILHWRKQTDPEWETTFPGTHHSTPDRAGARTQVSCFPGQESAAAYNWVYLCVHSFTHLLSAYYVPTREVTLKWDGMLRLRNNGINITAKMTNSPGVTGTWDEFPGHRNVSTKTTSSGQTGVSRSL